MEEVSYEIRDERIEQLLRDLGQRLKKDMPEGYGFTLLIFGFEPRNDLFYISSARRADMIATMREFIRKHEENG